MTRVSPGVSRDRVPVLAGRCDPLVERAIRDLYLRFYKFNAPVTNITQNPVVEVPEKKSTGRAIGAYTIVFTKDGFVNDDETSPSFTVNTLRDGFTPYKASLTADFAPAATLNVQFLLEGVNLLSAPLSLDSGDEGPVFTQSFAIPGKVSAGKRIKMKILDNGGAGQVVGEIVMRKVA